MGKWRWVLLSGLLSGLLLLLLHPPEQTLLRAINPPPEGGEPLSHALSHSAWLAQLSAAYPDRPLWQAEYRQGAPWVVARVADPSGARRYYLSPASGELLDLRGGRVVAAWVSLAEACRAALLRPPLALLWMLAGMALLAWRCGLWPKPRSGAVLDKASPWLVVYASQTGNAEQLARQSAAQLGDVPVLPLNDLSAERLQQCQQLLLLISTHGEGAPPDNAALFARRLLGKALPLAPLRFAVLALGDRRYPSFCGFARAISAWLTEQGGTRINADLLVDNLDPSALQQWQTQLQALGATTPVAIASTEPAWQGWTLSRRICLNPDSPSAPVFRLTLQPPAAAACQWQAGDLAYLSAPGDSQTVRAYSIASVMADGALELLVREQRREDGRPGRLSGWLGSVPLPARVQVQLRPNPGFHGPHSEQTPLLLIGSGTGLAGLRSHLRERWQRQAGENWLIFGERWPEYDRLCESELLNWQQQGHLQRLDRVFSRSEPGRGGYVQHQLAASRESLRQWLERGAALYVCGGLAMGNAVDATLRQLLGDQQVDQLLAESRYRRDVY